MAGWENTPVEDIIKAFKERHYPPELTAFLENKKTDVQSKPLLKHILPFLNAHELMKVPEQKKKENTKQKREDIFEETERNERQAVDQAGGAWVPSEEQLNKGSVKRKEVGEKIKEKAQPDDKEQDEEQEQTDDEEQDEEQEQPDDEEQDEEQEQPDDEEQDEEQEQAEIEEGYKKTCKNIHVKSYGDCQLLFDYLDELKEQPLKELSCKSPRYLKIFNDPIHGHIQLHPACQMIVDTPEFQRLRDIKQLGTVYYVYPGAAHNRFEHSLGVCHLGGQFTRALRESQPELGITDVDILCVEIAGLCRDLGHGPFSRLYLNKFLPAVNKDKKYRKPSAEMFQHLLIENGLTEKLRAYGITDEDRLFIIEQLGGARPTGSTAWPYKGRTKEKAYLYEIVVNHRNGIDVYKWDYLARDCHHLGIKNNFDPSRYMKFARVIEMEGEMQICIRDKEISNLYNMFYTRYTVNKYAYFHKVTCGIELMIINALEKANKWITFKGKENIPSNIYECHKDMQAFTQLTDNVIFVIRNFQLDKERPKQEKDGERWDDMTEAQKLIQRIFCRDLYACAYEAPPCDPKELEERLGVEKSLDELEGVITDRIVAKADLAKEDVIVKIISLHFGMKEENPVERLKVYSKHRLNEARHLKKEEASRILGPVKFNEVQVRVYSTKSAKDDSGQRRLEIEQCAKEILEAGA